MSVYTDLAEAVKLAEARLDPMASVRVTVLRAVLAANDRAAARIEELETECQHMADLLRRAGVCTDCG